MTIQSRMAAELRGLQTIQKSDLSDPQIAAILARYEVPRDRIAALQGELRSLGVSGANGTVSGQMGTESDEMPEEQYRNSRTGSAMTAAMRAYNSGVPKP